MYTNPNQIDMKRALAERLRGNVTPMSGNAHWAQAIANIVSPALGGVVDRKANQQEQENQKISQKEINMILSGRPQDVNRKALASALKNEHGVSDPALIDATNFWSGVQGDRQKQFDEYEYESPQAQNLIARRQEISANNQAALQRAGMVGSASARQFAGDRIVDTANGNRTVGYIQQTTNGSPQTHWLGEEGWKDSYAVLGSAAEAQYLPSVLTEATPAQAENANAVTTAEQEAITVGAGNRDDAQTENNIRESRITGTQETDLEALTEASTAYTNARNDIQSLERALEVNETSPSGSLGNVMSVISGVFDSAGIPNELYTDANILSATSGEILARYMQQLGARGLTDRDMDVLRSTLPNMNQSAEARAQIINVLIENKRRQMDSYSDFYSRYVNEYGGAPVSVSPPSQASSVGRFQVEVVR